LPQDHQIRDPGSPVSPGDIITYTITYTCSSDQACNNSKYAKIVDSIPIDTTYVPNSASDGISPSGDGALTWSVATAAVTGTKTFKVIVADTQCTNQRTVNNRAGLLAYGYAPVMSDVISHTVNCPPLGFPTTEPSYAEDELQVSPCPLMAGIFSEVSVRLTNSGASAAVVTVQFQVSPRGIRKVDVPPVHLPSNINPPWEEPEIVFIPTPPVAGSPGQLCIELNNPLGVAKTVTVEFSAADFGAGIGFTPIATRAFILPPHTFARYCVPWTPSASGTLHRCPATCSAMPARCPLGSSSMGLPSAVSPFNW
jgi:uncharacterized repeat protein (TIGR01451 family)